MRDFRDAKAMARSLRAGLAAKGLKITIAESLELIAKALGAGDWNTLAAAVRAAGAAEAGAKPPPPAAAAAPPPPEPAAPGLRHASFSPALEATLHKAVAAAAERRHGYTTLEHLLLVLADDPDATAVMQACQVDLARLRAELTRYLDEELAMLVELGDAAHVAPTAGFHRVVQRSVVHVMSSGRGVVTGANLLVAIFSERESHAAFMLGQQRMERADAVNFIAHGIRKDGKAA
jgi:hypothetical protein